MCRDYVMVNNRLTRLRKSMIPLAGSLWQRYKNATRGRDVGFIAK